MKLYRLRRTDALFYRRSLLTTPRGWTQDAGKARRSTFVYADETEYGFPGWWSTSWLGRLNGLLRVVGLKVRGHIASDPYVYTADDGSRCEEKLLFGYEIVRAR